MEPDECVLEVCSRPLVHKIKTHYNYKTLLLKHCFSSPITHLLQNGLVPLEEQGVINEGFENERDPEQVEGEPQQEVKNGARSDVDVEVQVDWTAELPFDITVPKVNIHSLVMDFCAVSFLDVMSVKSLRLVGVHSHS